MVKPIIGLALGSGGARGFAHAGVLKVLHENNVPVHLIAGTSMGSLVGALYASGQKVESLYQLAATFKKKYFLDFILPNMGFIKGERIKEYIRLFTFDKKIEEFDIPVGIVATNLFSGKKKVFYEGDTASAVRASISIPGIFVPEKIEDQLFVDGGVIDRVPVSVAKEMGADIVIGVDCAHFTANHRIHSIYDVIMQSIDIMQDELVRSIGTDAEIMLKPDVSHYSSKAFTDIMEIIREGEKEAEKRIEDIQDCIRMWKERNNEV